MKYKKALFIDLDGTIIETKSKEEFPKDENDWVFKNGTLSKIKKYSDDGYIVCIVTNQGGIQMGYITEEAFQRKLNIISVEIEDYIHAGINSVFCPDMDSYDRKPSPGMAYRFAVELKLDLKECLMVGDSDADRHFAANAGIGTFIHINDFIQNYR